MSSVYAPLIRLAVALWQALLEMDKKHGGEPPPPPPVPSGPLIPVWRVDVTYNLDRTGVVRINDHWELQVRRRHARFVDIIAADNGTSEDGIVDWKALSDVQAALAVPGKPTPSKEAISQLKYLVCNELTAAGLDRRLVQFDETLQAYRFVLRRNNTAACQSTNR
jgi:hypothetical protein